MPWSPEPLRAGYRCLVFEPAAAPPEGGWPLLLSLHGVHERGHDLSLVRRHGPPRAVDAWPDFPFLLVAPQCPSGQTWSVGRLTALLDAVAAHHPVDPDRVYLTGLSMGGYASWALAVEHPYRFAAVAPVCGGGDPRRAGRLRRLPVWAFHGRRDPVVPVAASREMVDALRRCGAPVRYTEFPDAGHDVWTAAYGDRRLYDWFLSHRRPRARRG